MIKKLLILVILILSISLAYSQDTTSTTIQSKLTSVNIMLVTIIDTPKGMILEYFGSTDVKRIYLPFDFFNKSIAVKVFEEDADVAPQASVIYKDLQPFKIKIYMPRKASSLTYRYKDMLSDEEKEKFKTTNLIVEF